MLAISHRLLPAMISLLPCVLAGAVVAAAENGPSPPVARAVDGVSQVPDGEGDDGPEAFISAAADTSEGPAASATGLELARRGHVGALEAAPGADLDALLVEFENDRFSDGLLEETTRDERRELLKAVQEAVAQAERSLLKVRNDTVVLRQEGARAYAIEFRLLPRAPYKIDALRVVDLQASAPPLALTADNLQEAFRELQRGGFSGVVHVRLGGEVLLEEPFGVANKDLAIPMSLDTIFGIGSTPIDFTIAAIALLEQQGRIDLDSPVSRYFGDAGGDQREFTARHLLTGRSGLPDFHHTDTDWDYDLAWIDRATAERRIFQQPLLFAPGDSAAHSHSAFVLLAALVERVSGQDYPSYIREHILDPAGMSRTGMYGEAGAFSVADFAVGGGPSFVGVPNIPPNWGPTSWLVMGSGGMYSTLGDLLRFYDFVATSGLLSASNVARYFGPRASAGGSDRGFFFFHIYAGPGDAAMMLTNLDGRTERLRAISRALEDLIEGAS